MFLKTGWKAEPTAEHDRRRPARLLPRASILKYRHLKMPRLSFVEVELNVGVKTAGDSFVIISLPEGKCHHFGH